jgi:hypothetical protein
MVDRIRRWDGRHFSNTHNLVVAGGYSGVFIEAKAERFEELKKTYASSKHVLLNAYVGWGKGDSLDAMLEGKGVPRDVDLLSIDIDGNDYHVWEAVDAYAPKLVIIEYNHTANNSVLFVQERHANVNHGSSAAALVELSRRKGYELIAVTFLNLLFAQREYFLLFRIPDNSLDVMRDDSHCPQIFSGYDGHVFLGEGRSRGTITLPWHQFKVDEKEVQAIPRWLRKYPYPDSYSLLDRIAWKILVRRNSEKS